MADALVTTGAGYAGDANLPQGEIALGVAELFSEVFGAPAGIDAEFFELGGDSLAGETLLAGVEARFGVTLPLSILLEATTPAALAKSVVAFREHVVPRTIVPIRSKGAGPPLFCLHGSDGEPMFPRRLAADLPRRPIYGIRAQGLLEGEVPDTRAVKMAARYVDEIRKVQPVGPYLIAGHCAPATVAYEMAQQLRHAGQDVAGLILFDPSASQRAPWLHGSGVLASLWRLVHRTRGLRAYVAARWSPGMEGKKRRIMLNRSIRCADGTYVPEQYDGQTLMICSSARAPSLLNTERGYPTLIANLATVTVPGRHTAVFRGEDRSRVPAATAEAVATFLDRVMPV
jgi:pimeloyl-ACP methyl ester carboxylesterase